MNLFNAFCDIWLINGILVGFLGLLVLLVGIAGVILKAVKK